MKAGTRKVLYVMFILFLLSFFIPVIFMLLMQMTGLYAFYFLAQIADMHFTALALCGVATLVGALTNEQYFALVQKLTGMKKS